MEIGKTLIAITSCNRLDEVKKYIWDYLDFVNSNVNFHFVLSLDGNNQEYLDFCDDFNIPLLYSDEREGVGLSKNRILSSFPDYDYYFFIEDDIELLNGAIFGEIIQLHSIYGFPHFCNHHPEKMTGKIEKMGKEIEFSNTGGAQFAFYSKLGLSKVGGFHTLFAKYRRFGHTEHTYRFFKAGLQPAPFIFHRNYLKGYFLIHNPPRVTNISVKSQEDELIDEERELIDATSYFFPLQTISEFSFNNKKMGWNELVVNFLNTSKRPYPQLSGSKRRLVLAERNALMAYHKKGLSKLWCLLKAFILNYKDNSLRHYLKTEWYGK